MLLKTLQLLYENIFLKIHIFRNNEEFRHFYPLCTRTQARTHTHTHV